MESARPPCYSYSLTENFSSYRPTYSWSPDWSSRALLVLCCWSFVSKIVSCDVLSNRWTSVRIDSGWIRAPGYLFFAALSASFQTPLFEIRRSSRRLGSCSDFCYLFSCQRALLSLKSSEKLTYMSHPVQFLSFLIPSIAQRINYL